MSWWFVVKLACVHAGAAVALAGCAASTPTHDNLMTEVDTACGGPQWRHQHALQAEVTIRRAGQSDWNGLMTYDVRGNRLTLTFPASSDSHASFGFDGSGLWIDCPSNFECREWPTLLQWASWVAVPYRLTDPDLRVREVEPVSIDGVSYRVAELERPSQGRGVCALYVEPHTLRPRIARPVCPPEMTSHEASALFAFTYDQFSTCGLVQVPTKWSIWGLNARQGQSTTAPVASVTLQRLHFVDIDPLVFEPPLDESADHSSTERILPDRSTAIRTAAKSQ